MKLLKDRILKDGKVIDNRIIKVDNFLNHQLDVELFNEMGKEFKNRFANKKITKILTIETSGIAIACITAQYFNVPVVFAKKQVASNLTTDVYESEVYSFTKGKLSKIRVDMNYLNPQDKVLIIDDFLAHGNAVLGLIDIVNQAGAEVSGVGIVIEKGFQKGREVILSRMSVQIESLAIIENLENGQVVFAQ
ncbi:MAG: xanthine phosphoribosyltransferase [Clostridia bacterium]|jgi:xanthine phosphoribosyltransferase|nr:xanthine phosphoribosyltransferase [Clostridia bacterium]MDN5322808.1 xanthine phosphoribosyltransferase [Clostridia bacterium]